MIQLNASVGLRAKNFPRDVKRIQALMNVYLRTINSQTIEISGVNSKDLEKLINDFQTNYIGLTTTASSRIEPSDRTVKKLRELLDSSFKPMPISAPAFGRVTWDSEGHEGGPFHSRKLHVPSTASGLTLGRGYDCRRKSEGKIMSDLLSCGLESKKSEILSKSRGLFGESAKEFIVENDLLDFQLSPEQQRALFKISYQDEAAEVKRICEKNDVVQIYGKTNWSNLHPAIKDITIDLKFRGDYTGSTRRFIQNSISGNDLSAFKAEIKKKENWTDVPPDRFKRRAEFISKAEDQA